MTTKTTLRSNGSSKIGDSKLITTKTILESNGDELDSKRNCVANEVSKRDKIKNYLTSKVVECEKIIKQRKKKNKIIKGLYFTLITTSIIGSSIVIILSSLTVPPLVIASVSGVTTITSALSIKFSLQDKKNKLEQNIQNLHKIKDKLDYIIICNGDLTEDECNEIMDQFRIL